MKLYDSLRAPNPRRVRWFLAEKGVDDIEIVDIDLLKGAHKQKSFLDRAGAANVPVLELDDGLALTESIAICRYLESLYPEPNMFGRDAREAAVIEMWTRRVELGLANPLMLSVRHTHPALAVLENQIPAVAENHRGAADRALQALDVRLTDRDFIAADRITLADIILVCAIDFARLVRFRLPEDMGGLRRWYAAMSARPAAKAGVTA